MNNLEELQYLLSMFAVFHDSIMGAFGGFISYLFDYIKAGKAKDKGKRVTFVFRWSSLLTMTLMGAFVAGALGTMLNSGAFARDVFVAFSGLCAYQIIYIADSKFPAYIMNLMLNRGNSGGSSCENKDNNKK